MNKHRLFPILPLVVCGVVSAALLWLALALRTSAELAAQPLDKGGPAIEFVNTATSIPVSSATPTFEVINRRHILAGKSLEEIAEHAVRHFVPLHLDSVGEVQVLLARYVTRTEFTALGLGCLPSGIPLEEPPYVLVVLEGSFRQKWSRILDSSLRAHYAAFMVDVWAAGSTVTITSGNGDVFRQALGDPTLPTPNPTPEFPTVCPTPYYTNIPHGAVIPGIIFPTALPEPTVPTTPTIPPPVGTVPVPTP
jgi:hypothetical protein